MYISGLMVSKSEFKSSGLRFFPGRREYEFAFQFWYCELYIKNQWGETDLILLFLQFGAL